MKLDYKVGVNFRPTMECLTMVPYVADAYEIFTDLGTLTITSANDLKHRNDSKHYENNALDFRVWGLDAWERAAIVHYLNHELEPNYQFLDENDHIHGEYDPR